MRREVTLTAGVSDLTRQPAAQGLHSRKVEGLISLFASCASRVFQVQPEDLGSLTAFFFFQSFFLLCGIIAFIGPDTVALGWEIVQKVTLLSSKS
jgi:hypothetical protein